MTDKTTLYYSLFLITIFICCFLILKSIIHNKIKFLNKIIIKKNSDLKMHSYKIYQNAGFIVIGLFLIFSYSLYLIFYKNLYFIENISRPIIFFVSILILYSMSIYDFKKNLHPIFRLITQVTVAYISLTLINFPIVEVEYIPLKIQFLIVVIFWVYLINITNFVDGLDGLIGITAIGFFTNVLLFSVLFNIQSLNIYISSLIIPLLAAFLIFNKPKAKIFLNDVGSIPLGYIIGFCLLNIFQNNNWYFFISVFLYFILDVSFTLIMKIKKGYYPWARLFDYQFLQPVLKGGKPHRYVLRHIVLYYLLMSFIIIIIYFYKLNNIYLFIYSLISSLIIFYKFNNFNSKIS